MGSRRTRAEVVRDELLSDLRAGRYPTGAKLPPEDDLARQYDVSRATVREAVQSLVEVGYVSRRHGTGTFVTRLPTHRHSIDMTVSYTAMIRDAGMTPGETVVASEERPATPQEAERLGIEAGTALVCIERVRTADGSPAIYSEDRIPGALLAGVSEAPRDTSLYDLLTAAGLSIHHAIATLRPVLADARLARLLGASKGSPLQYVEQVDYTAEGTAAMLSSEWHLPGVFELSVNRRPLDSES